MSLTIPAAECMGLTSCCQQDPESVTFQMALEFSFFAETFFQQLGSKTAVFQGRKREKKSFDGLFSCFEERQLLLLPNRTYESFNTNAHNGLNYRMEAWNYSTTFHEAAQPVLYVDYYRRFFTVSVRLLSGSKVSSQDCQKHTAASTQNQHSVIPSLKRGLYFRC